VDVVLYKFHEFLVYPLPALRAVGDVLADVIVESPESKRAVVGTRSMYPEDRVIPAPYPRRQPLTRSVHGVVATAGIRSPCRLQQRP